MRRLGNFRNISIKAIYFISFLIIQINYIYSKEVGRPVVLGIGWGIGEFYYSPSTKNYKEKFPNVQMVIFDFKTAITNNLYFNVGYNNSFILDDQTKKLSKNSGYSYIYTGGGLSFIKGSFLVVLIEGGGSIFFDSGEKSYFLPYSNIDFVIPSLNISFKISYAGRFNKYIYPNHIGFSIFFDIFGNSDVEKSPFQMTYKEREHLKALKIFRKGNENLEQKKYSEALNRFLSVKKILDKIEDKYSFYLENNNKIKYIVDLYYKQIKDNYFLENYFESFKNLMFLLDNLGTNIYDYIDNKIEFNNLFIDIIEEGLLKDENTFQNGIEVYKKVIDMFPDEDISIMAQQSGAMFLYKKALQSKNKIDALENIIKNWDGTVGAEKAKEKLAQILYKKAIKTGDTDLLKKIIDDFSDTDVVDKAKEILPRLLYEKGIKEENIGLLKQVINDFPDTKIAGKARKKLAKLLYTQAVSYDDMSLLQQIINDFPDTAEAKKAKNKISLLLYKEAKNKKSYYSQKEELENIIDEYPGTKGVRLAKKRLVFIKKKIRENKRARENWCKLATLMYKEMGYNIEYIYDGDILILKLPFYINSYSRRDIILKTTMAWGGLGGEKIIIVLYNDFTGKEIDRGTIIVPDEFIADEYK